MRSSVLSGAKFPAGGRWRLVGRLPVPEPVIVLGGEEGLTMWLPTGRLSG